MASAHSNILDAIHQVSRHTSVTQNHFQIRDDILQGLSRAQQDEATASQTVAQYQRMARTYHRLLTAHTELYQQLDGTWTEFKQVGRGRPRSTKDEEYDRIYAWWGEAVLNHYGWTRTLNINYLSTLRICAEQWHDFADFVDHANLVLLRRHHAGMLQVAGQQTLGNPTVFREKELDFLKGLRKGNKTIYGFHMTMESSKQHKSLIDAWANNEDSAKVEAYVDVGGTTELVSETLQSIFPDHMDLYRLQKDRFGVFTRRIVDTLLLPPPVDRDGSPSMPAAAITEHSTVTVAGDDSAQALNSVHPTPADMAEHEELVVPTPSPRILDLNEAESVTSPVDSREGPDAVSEHSSVSRSGHNASSPLLSSVRSSRTSDDGRSSIHNQPCHDVASSASSAIGVVRADQAEETPGLHAVTEMHPVSQGHTTPSLEPNSVLARLDVNTTWLEAFDREIDSLFIPGQNTLIESLNPLLAPCDTDVGAMTPHHEEARALSQTVIRTRRTPNNRYAPYTPREMVSPRDVQRTSHSRWRPDAQHGTELASIVPASRSTGPNLVGQNRPMDALSSTSIHSPAMSAISSSDSSHSTLFEGPTHASLDYDMTKITEADELSFWGPVLSKVPSTVDVLDLHLRDDISGATLHEGPQSHGVATPQMTELEHHGTDQPLPCDNIAGVDLVQGDAYEPLEHEWAFDELVHIPDDDAANTPPEMARQEMLDGSLDGCQDLSTTAGTSASLTSQIHDPATERISAASLGRQIWRIISFRKGLTMQPPKPLALHLPIRLPRFHYRLGRKHHDLAARRPRERLEEQAFKDNAGLIRYWLDRIDREAKRPDATPQCRARARWFNDMCEMAHIYVSSEARDAALLSGLSPYDDGDADARCQTMQEFERGAREGGDIEQPTLVYAGPSSNLDLQEPGLLFDTLHHRAARKQIMMHELQGGSSRICVADFIALVNRPDPPSVYTTDLHREIKALPPTFTYLPRFDVLNRAATAILDRSHGTSSIESDLFNATSLTQVSTPGSFSGPTIHGLGGAYIRVTFGVLAVMFVSLKHTTGAATSFAKEGIDFDPGRGVRVIFLRRGDLLWIPAGHPYATVTLQTCSSVGQVLCDEKDIDFTLADLCRSVDYPASCSPPLPAQLAQIVREMVDMGMATLSRYHPLKSPVVIKELRRHSLYLLGGLATT